MVTWVAARVTRALRGFWSPSMGPHGAPAMPSSPRRAPALTIRPLTVRRLVNARRRKSRPPVNSALEKLLLALSARRDRAGRPWLPNAALDGRHHVRPHELQDALVLAHFLQPARGAPTRPRAPRAWPAASRGCWRPPWATRRARSAQACASAARRRPPPQIRGRSHLALTTAAETRAATAASSASSSLERGQQLLERGGHGWSRFAPTSAQEATHGERSNRGRRRASWR